MQETQEMRVWSLGGEDPLEEGMATPSSILAWRISCTAGPGGLQSLGSQRVGHDWSNWARTHACMTYKVNIQNTYASITNFKWNFLKIFFCNTIKKYDILRNKVNQKHINSLRWNYTSLLKEIKGNLNTVSYIPNVDGMEDLVLLSRQ